MKQWWVVIEGPAREGRIYGTDLDDPSDDIPDLQLSIGTGELLGPFRTEREAKIWLEKLIDKGSIK